MTNELGRRIIPYKVIQSGEKMKLVRSAPLNVIALTLGLTILAGAMDAQAQFKRNLAFVRSVVGSATYTDGAKSGTVTRGLFLHEGSRITTTGGSYVDLFLGENGPFVRVTESSNLVLDRLQFRETAQDFVIETSLNLRDGRVIGQVKKTSPASRYEVVTPTMVAGIRGTDYDISADGTTKVYDGQVVVAYSVDGQVPTFLVNGGFKFNPTTQQVVPIDTGLDGFFPDFPGLNLEEWVEITNNGNQGGFDEVRFTGGPGRIRGSIGDALRDLDNDSGTSFISPTSGATDEGSTGSSGTTE